MKCQAVGCRHDAIEWVRYAGSNDIAVCHTCANRIARYVQNPVLLRRLVLTPAVVRLLSTQAQEAIGQRGRLSRSQGGR